MLVLLQIVCYFIQNGPISCSGHTHTHTHHFHIIDIILHSHVWICARSKARNVVRVGSGRGDSEKRVSERESARGGGGGGVVVDGVAECGRRTHPDQDGGSL